MKCVDGTVTEAVGDGVPGTFLTGSTRGVWPESNLNVKKVGKREGRRSWPPLPITGLPLLLSHQWGILATLIHVVHSYFNPEPALWRKRVGTWWRCWRWAGGEVAFCHCCSTSKPPAHHALLWNPPKPDNIRIPSNSLWLPLKCHWHCLALQFAGSKERAHVIEINLKLVMGMEMNTSFMLWLRSESWILRCSLVSLESRLLTL